MTNELFQSPETRRGHIRVVLLLSDYVNGMLLLRVGVFVGGENIGGRSNLLRVIFETSSSFLERR